jgi:cation:H+ antiporter
MLLIDFIGELSLPGVIGLFILAAAVIGSAGFYLTRYADKLADRTGLGEAITGALFLGGVTSLSGIITSVTAASTGHPELSASNAIGGIAAQTAFLAIADIAYRRSNLEHAAASLPNIMQGVLLLGLLSIVLMIGFLPSVTLFAVHPVTPLLFLLYIWGLRLMRNARKMPMWRPKRTSKTVEDVPDEDSKREPLGRTIFLFTSLALLIAVAGYVVARCGIRIAEGTPLSESIVGSLFTAVSTSLPELFVAIMAVRQNALTMAVSNIIGGNSFDVLFFAVSDIAYRGGSLYHDAGERVFYIITLTLLMTAVLILGMLVRERQGVGGIGWESAAVLFLFLAGFGLLFFLY